MKKLILLLVLAFASISGVYAQSGDSNIEYFQGDYVRFPVSGIGADSMRAYIVVNQNTDGIAGMVTILGTDTTFMKLTNDGYFTIDTDSTKFTGKVFMNDSLQVEGNIQVGDTLKTNIIYNEAGSSDQYIELNNVLGTNEEGVAMIYNDPDDDDLYFTYVGDLRNVGLYKSIFITLFNFTTNRQIGIIIDTIKTINTFRLHDDSTEFTYRLEPYASGYEGISFHKKPEGGAFTKLFQVDTVGNAYIAGDMTVEGTIIGIDSSWTSISVDTIFNNRTNVVLVDTDLVVTGSIKGDTIFLPDTKGDIQSIQMNGARFELLDDESEPAGIILSSILISDNQPPKKAEIDYSFVHYGLEIETDTIIHTGQNTEGVTFKQWITDGIGGDDSTIVRTKEDSSYIISNNPIRFNTSSVGIDGSLTVGNSQSVEGNIQVGDTLFFDDGTYLITAPEAVDTTNLSDSLRQAWIEILSIDSSWTSIEVDTINAFQNSQILMTAPLTIDNGTELFAVNSGGLINGKLINIDDITLSNITFGELAGGSFDGTAIHNIAIGYDAGGDITSGDYNILLGRSAGDNITTGSFNLALGDNALTGDPVGLTGVGNIGIGFQAGDNITSGGYNYLIGFYAGRYVTTGSNNYAIGRDALYGNVSGITGQNNIGIGYKTGYSLTTGSNNIAVGYTALGDTAQTHGNVTGSYNIALGNASNLYNTTASYNISIGFVAAGDAVGRTAGVTGGDNVFIGRSSGGSIQDGLGNICIGYRAGLENVGGDRNILIGYRAGELTTGSDILIIGNSETDSLIYADMAADELTINGTYYETINTIADNDATPDVTGGNLWQYNGSANSVTVTDLDNPVAGATYTIVGNSDTYTMTFNDGGNFTLAGGVSFVMGADDVLVVLCLADNNYIEISRSDN